MSKQVIKFTNIYKNYLIQKDKTVKDLLPSLVSKRNGLEKFPALDNISFTINQGEKVALVGNNGAGKSTILKLIARVSYPDNGQVKVAGRIAPLIELGAGFHHELTGYENIFLNAAILGMGRKQIEAKLQQIIDFSELGEFIYVPVKRYSSGMYMRLAFAVAIHVDASILLIDEILAVGDKNFQKKCLNKLNQIKKDKRKTVLLVSHDQTDIKKFCDRAIYIKQGKIMMDGQPAKVLNKYNRDCAKASKT